MINTDAYQVYRDEKVKKDQWYFIIGRGKGAVKRRGFPTKREAILAAEEYIKEHPVIKTGITLKEIAIVLN